MFYYIVITTFSNFQLLFFIDFTKTTQDFAHATSHIKHPKYDSISGNKSLYV